MSQKLLRGFVWFAYPDLFGIEEGAAANPGHPFSSDSGEMKLPEEVLYFRRSAQDDTGVTNVQRPSSYLILSRTQFHPRLSGGWESEPAVLGDKFQTGDGKVRLTKIIGVHHRHSGDLMECELKIEQG